MCVHFPFFVYASPLHTAAAAHPCTDLHLMNVLSKCVSDLIFKVTKPVTTAEVFRELPAVFQGLPWRPDPEDSIRMVIVVHKVLVTAHVVEVLEICRRNRHGVAAVNADHVAFHIRVLTLELW